VTSNMSATDFQCCALYTSLTNNGWYMRVCARLFRKSDKEHQGITVIHKDYDEHWQ